MKGFIFLLVLDLGAKADYSNHDSFREWIETSPPFPDNLSLQLVSFGFEFSTHSTSSHFLDLFPQSVASVLIANRKSIKSLTGRIVRGRWRWTHPHPIFPTGASMILDSSPEDRPRLWTQSAWLLSTLLGASFESLAPEQNSFSWITPMDVSSETRVGANPNEPVCTDNLQRLVQMLPCRDRRGLGKELIENALSMASSEYIEIGLVMRNIGNTVVVTGEVNVVLPIGEYLIQHPCFNTQSDNRLVRKFIPRNTIPSIRVKRSLIGSELGPERRYGRLTLVLENADNTASHSIELHDQLPYFLVPLLGKSDIRGAQIRWSDPLTDSPTYMAWNLTLAPSETRIISLHVYKKFIPMSKFSFSFEKGFDIGSAAFRVDSEEWQLTRGLVVVIPLPDQTSTFNAMAVAVTPIALFFGTIFRSFVDKRSELMDERKAGERDPPLFRLLRFIVGRIKRLWV